MFSLSCAAIFARLAGSAAAASAFLVRSPPALLPDFERTAASRAFQDERREVNMGEATCPDVGASGARAAREVVEKLKGLAAVEAVTVDGRVLGAGGAAGAWVDACATAEAEWGGSSRRAGVGCRRLCQAPWRSTKLERADNAPESW